MQEVVPQHGRVYWHQKLLEENLLLLSMVRIILKIRLKDSIIQ